MTDPSTSFVQRSKSQIHFQHADMDFYLSWIMGRHIYGASDRDECLQTASRIEDGAPDSWQAEWSRLAEKVEADAETASSRGDTRAAYQAYLRACTYYRASLFIMQPDHPAFFDLAERMRACFRSAAVLNGAKIESLEVPYGQAMLSGYFAGADGGPVKRTILVVVGGIETFAEDCFFMIGPSALREGFHFLTLDLPGQGFNPAQGSFFGARMERPMEALLDYARSRPEAANGRLAVFGFSWGGHIVFKAGEHDGRIDALIANPPMPDVFRASLAQQRGHDRSDPVAQRVFKQIAWRMGLKISFNPVDIARRVGKAYDYLFHGKADVARIGCPTLCLAGEAEAPVTLEIARECIGSLSHPRSELIIFSEEDGSAAHCQVDNLDVPNKAIFRWLGQVLPSQPG